jgi:glutathione S-transferase
MQMLELFQTEWCPASRRVRQRLTELGLDYINRQVPVEREARTALREAVGTDTIPALRLENGSSIVGEENILVYLSEHFAEGREAEAHQQKAAKARRRYLEEECQCSQPATRSASGRHSRSKRPSSASARS